MNFETAFHQAQAGAQISLPEWGGYWVWDPEKKTIMIHEKDGNVLDFRDTPDVGFTLPFTFRKDWEEVQSIDPDDDGDWFEEMTFHPAYKPLTRQGDSGPLVRMLQDRLNHHGANLEPDGKFGKATRGAVMSFQRSRGLVADGIVGEKTLLALDGERATWLLTQEDLNRGADTLGIPVAALMAFNEVESNGRGFLPSGLPKILFERHWMYRRLKHHGVDPTPYLSSHPNIVATITRGYLGGQREYDRLSSAKQIHVDAALESASWGAFQIMGFHWASLGYASIQEFVRQMNMGEREHLEAVIRFIQRDAVLLDALRKRNWNVVAERYNGRNYRQPPPGYHVKLKNAFNDYVKDYPLAA